MLPRTLRFGILAGLIVAVPMIVMTFGKLFVHGIWGMVVGYLIMLAAFSMIFLAVKQQRDVTGGGVIAFWPALAIGVGITVIATVFYVLTWELVTSLSHMNFADDYARATIAQAEASGTSGAQFAQLKAQMPDFQRNYANPLYRTAMTATEILPVGLLVSLVVAALLRNSRFLPARALPA